MDAKLFRFGVMSENPQLRRRQALLRHEHCDDLLMIWIPDNSVHLSHVKSHFGALLTKIFRRKPNDLILHQNYDSSLVKDCQQFFGLSRFSSLRIDLRPETLLVLVRMSLNPRLHIVRQRSLDLHTAR